MFIVFEGIEGSGKSTQISLLARRLEERGIACVVTREPGGTAVGEQIRAVFMHSDNHAMMPLTELLLVAAARVQHVHEVVRPALDAGRVVLCDRFCDATMVYQGYAGDVPIALISQCHRMFCDALLPDLTVLLDCPVDVGLGRSRARNAQCGRSRIDGRFEDRQQQFHQRVRDGYRALAQAEPHRFAVFDACLDAVRLQEQIAAVVLARLKEHGDGV